MDFRILFQLREKRFWWMDVIFYFAVSLLIATVFCYVIFWVKNSIQRQEIKDQITALESVGTGQQKEYEKSVLYYQKKLNDFANIFENHEFASHVFAFMQDHTMPNIWFRQFALDRKNSKVELFGEADDMASFSRQVAVFEESDTVDSVSGLNSALGQEVNIQFSLDMALNPEIFAYIPGSDLLPIEEINYFPEEISEESNTSTEIMTEESETPGEQVSEQPPPLPPDIPKMITVFDFLLTPEVIGTVDQENHTVSIDVPYGTNLTSLQTFIITSANTTIIPGSGVVQDFTNPVTYIVTAEDGSTQEYTVRVNVLPEEKTGAGLTRSGMFLLAVGFVVVMALVILGAFFIFKKRLKNNNQTNASR